MKSFLRYYRELGVTRFIVVDDRSDDGTTEILSLHPMWTCSVQMCVMRRLTGDGLGVMPCSIFTDVSAGICLSMPTSFRVSKDGAAGYSLLYQ